MELFAEPPIVPLGVKLNDLPSGMKQVPSRIIDDLGVGVVFQALGSP